MTAAARRRAVDAGLAAFLRWWGAELRDMLPRRLRRARPALVFLLEDEGIAARLVGGAGPRRLGAWTPAATEPAPAWAARMRARAGRRTRVGLRVAPEAVLRRRVTMPDAVREDVRGVVGYEIDRLTPYRADDVVYDAAVALRDRAAGTCAIDVRVVPRAEIDRLRAAAAALGLRPAFVDAPASIDAPAAAVDRLEGAGGAAAAGRPRLVAALAILAIALAAAAAAIPLAREAAEAEGAAVAAESARLSAAYAARLRAEIDRLEGAARAGAGRRAHAPDALEVLRAVTALLPDDAYLTAFEIGGGRLRLMGHAASATAVLTAIEAAPQFEETAFRAPVTPSPQPGRELFQIVANIAREPGG